MKRKQTELEKKIMDHGFRLSHKTYTGKNYDKNDTYVFIRKTNDFTFYVELDKNRDKIVTYYFESGYSYKYNGAIINTIREIYDNFYHELCCIYDFVEDKLIEEGISLESPFVEESYFDDDSGEITTHGDFYEED